MGDFGCLLDGCLDGWLPSGNSLGNREIVWEKCGKNNYFGLWFYSTFLEKIINFTLFRLGLYSKTYASIVNIRCSYSKWIQYQRRYLSDQRVFLQYQRVFNPQ